MKALQEIIEGFAPVGDHLEVAGLEAQPYAAIDPRKVSVELKDEASARIVVLHTKAEECAMRIKVGRSASLELTELFLAEVKSDAEIEQKEGSQCHVTSVALAGSECEMRMNLNAPHAENTLHGLFIVGDEEKYSLNLLTRHNMPDCTSNSAVKGVAGDEAKGRFYGLVYVAPDAQRTDAQQQSRNILLSEDAQIDTKPQLEIYADDVKCTHGATVGQMDDEAILYMRQRGLSELQARALQIEGFASDVVCHSGVEVLHEPLMELVRAKMEQM